MWGQGQHEGDRQRVGVTLLHGISFVSWEKVWRSPRSTLCAHPAWSGEKSWLGSTFSFNPALQGSWVRPGVLSFPCARHGSTCPGWGPVLAQVWDIPPRGRGAKGCQGSEGSPGAMELGTSWHVEPGSTWHWCPLCETGRQGAGTE